MFMIRGKKNYIHYLIYSSESTVMVFYIAPLLIKELTTQENKCRSEPKLMELTGLIISAPHPPSPEVAGLMKQWNDLLKTQPARRSILQNWSKLPRSMCMLWISIQYMVVFLPIARIYGSRNKDVDMRMAPLFIISSNPLEKICFLFPSLMLLP